MRETGEGDSMPSGRGDCLCERRAEGKEILDSTSTTYRATERLRLDDDDLRLSTTGPVLGGGGGPPPASLAVPRPYPPLPSIPTNSPYIPLPRPPPLPSNHVRPPASAQPYRRRVRPAVPSPPRHPPRREGHRAPPQHCRARRMAELGPRSSLAYRESTMFIFFRSSLNFPQRLMYDSRARAVAHGDMTLPTVRSQSDVQALVDYLDGVFATMTTQHSFLGSPYPTIAWSPDVTRDVTGSHGYVTRTRFFFLFPISPLFPSRDLGPTVPLHGPALYHMT